MTNKIYEILERNPVIPAIKNDTNLASAIKSDSEVVFVIISSILNIFDIVKSLKESKKMVFVHVDMIDGLASTNDSVKFVMTKVCPDGIITTKHSIVSYARKNGIKVIQRFFILDSYSLTNTISHIKETPPDAVEILPGLMPKIIKKISNEFEIPLITGGLITEKIDILNAISNGALGVSTTKKDLWGV